MPEGPMDVLFVTLLLVSAQAEVYFRPAFLADDGRRARRVLGVAGIFNSIGLTMGAWKTEK